MKVAVIGGGSAGLTAAWLLQHDHDVTLIEKQPRLGGHAHAVEVPHAGGSILVESGCEFFTEAAHHSFHRLLDALALPLRRYPMTFTLYLQDSGKVYLLPPKRAAGFFWPALAPNRLSRLLQFEHFMRCGARLVERRDLTVTIGDFIAGLRFSPSFRDDFLYPFLLGGWGIPLAAFRQFAAYNVVKYLVLHRPQGLAPRAFLEVDRSTAAYISALRHALERVSVCCGTEIRCIRRAAGGYAIVDASGTAREFDHLVFATNAADARRMLHCVEGIDEQRAVLSRFRYFSTWIAVHGDRRLMPPDERHWSVFNVRCCNGRSLTTVWKQQETAAPVFKSWVDPDAPLPEPLYHLTCYNHPLVDVEHFRAQQHLAALQGRHNLWFAGVHTHDIDSHESAIQSAMRVARGLAPASRNLARLV